MKKSLLDAYWKAAGEVEARNVEKRYTSKLSGLPPWITQDTPLRDQFNLPPFKKKGGSA